MNPPFNFYTNNMPAKTETEKELTTISNQLVALNKSNRAREVFLRGVINGVASGIGATIGLAIVIFFLSQVFRQISAVPFIDQILKETKLDKVIQYQVQQVEKIGTTPAPTTTGTVLQTTNSN
jgi:hypothetical protein